MHTRNINDVLPHEILFTILNLAAGANQADGVRYTYGLTQAPTPLQTTKLTRYIRGPVSSESLRWDSTESIRRVCSGWHQWALAYNLEHVLERRWRGSERWAELSLRRPKYNLYELIDRPSGYAVYRDPFESLKKTNRLFNEVPSAANHVRRLWFDGFFTAETDKLILSVIANCDALEYLSVPWTILRRASAEDWIDLLNVNTGHGKALHSLELKATGLPRDQAEALEQDDTPNPLNDDRIDFSALKRLKIFGNTLHKPVCDADLEIISRTATNLECLDVTNLSTVSVAGMLALVQSSSRTLQVLEHSPRSDDGFYHPYPGRMATDEHACESLAQLPRMRDLSISVPHMCAALFANHEVHWTGECQVRATDFCGCGMRTTPAERARQVHSTFTAARTLIDARRRMRSRELSIELFFAGCIFEPAKELVHGDFALAEVASGGQWPKHSWPSTKGPYGASGVYGKEEGLWDAVSEQEYLTAVERGWISL